MAAPYLAALCHLALLGLALLGDPAEVSAQRASLRPSDRAVVRVLGVHSEDAVAVGTGFFVTDTGLIATAAHVVLDARVLVGISAATGETFRLVVRVLDEATDVAILEASGVTPPATLAVTGALPTIVAGDQVSVSGYSGGEMRELAPAISVGHISRSLSDGSMELGASVNPGQSGGPVLSSAGELLGLVSARADPASGVIGVALIRPRVEVAAALERATVLAAERAAASASSEPTPAPDLTRLVAYRAGALELASLSWDEVQQALESARSAMEYAEALVAAATFVAVPGRSSPAISDAVRGRARTFTTRYPQMFVLYPSLARVTLE